MERDDSNGFSAVAWEHANDPRNYGPPPTFDGHARYTGPCGDTMEMWISVSGDMIARISFITDGCASSLACGSMTTTLVQGRGLQEAVRLQQKDVLDALGEFPMESEHCALLAVQTFRNTCDDYLQRRISTAAPSHGNSSARGSRSDPDSQTPFRKTDESDREAEDRMKLESRLSRIRHKVVVLSGKGGVGKSTIAVNLATALMLSGKRVGLLDVDIHGPSIPIMLGLEKEKIHGGADGLIPAELGEMKVMSLGFLLQSQDDAVIWRGPMKMGVIQQFLRDVDWGELDYLIIDSPPGTGDEPLSVCQLIGKLDGAVVVTTPQKVAAVDVRKSITFCRKLDLHVLGVIENMSGFVCPKCGEVTSVLRSGGGKQIADDMDTSFLGSIPLDPQISASCDSGQAFIHHYPNSPAAAVMRNIVDVIAELDNPGAGYTTKDSPTHKEHNCMKIAIPLADGKLSMHFGHCERFALVSVDETEKKMLERVDIDAPPHEPGLLPPWLAERGVHLIIAGGMGQRAQDLFAAQNIDVIVGAAAATPEQLIDSYLAGTLVAGENVCDH